MVDALCKHILKGRAMPKTSRKNSLPYLTNLVLRHSPGVTIKMLAAINSEWGQLHDEQRAAHHDLIDIEGGTHPMCHPKSQPDVSAPSQ
jgi:hypothetical protein